MASDESQQEKLQPAKAGGEPIDAETRQSFEEKKEEALDKFRETYKPKRSPGSKGIDERALGAFDNTLGELKLQIDKCFDERMQAFANTAERSKTDREALKEQLLNDAEQEARQRIEGLKAALDQHSKGPEITTAEVRDINHAIAGMEKLLKDDHGPHEVMEKLHKKQPLDKKDYERVSDILKPQDVNKPMSSPEEAFDATAAGYLVGLMTMDQRVELVKVFIDSIKGGDAPELIDAFLRTGLLEPQHGQELFQLAVTNGKLTKEKFEEKGGFKEKLDGGFYAEEVEKNRKEIQEEVRKNYAGRYATNIMNRVVGRPLVGGLMALWGLVWFGLNAAVNKGKFWKSPYSVAALGALGVGTTIAIGGFKDGAPWFRWDAIGRMLHGNGGSNVERKESFNDNARNQLIDVYKNAPQELIAYLNNGGFATIKALRTQLETAKAKERPFITIDGLIQLEKNPDQKNRLAMMKTLTFVNEESINNKLNIVAEAAHILKIHDNEAFSTEIAAILKEQKTAQATTVAAPPTSPEPPPASSEPPPASPEPPPASSEPPPASPEPPEPPSQTPP